MLSRSALKELLQDSRLSQSDKLVLCLAVEDPRPLSVREVVAIGTDAGWRSDLPANPSARLGDSNGRAVRTSGGWELTQTGRESVAEMAGDLVTVPSAQLAATLRKHAENISSEQTARFVDEAVRCFEFGQLRAAVVLSWVGAVAVLQDHVVANRLSDFNREAKRRDSRWREAKNRDDLARMKEYDFLNVLESISVLGKSTKQELQNCRQLRNGCGHPNDLQVGEKRVEAHLEVLIDNVFAQF